jgi:hypothetical protein
LTVTPSPSAARARGCRNGGDGSCALVTRWQLPRGSSQLGGADPCRPTISRVAAACARCDR